MNREMSGEKGLVYHGRASVDYVLPFDVDEKNKVEAGYQISLNNSISTKDVYEYNSSIREFIVNPHFQQNREYLKNINSLYGLYSFDSKNFGYQGGLRLEYSYRKVSLIDSSADFTINRLDYFPSLHAFYRFKYLLQLMTSYSRRIRRPRGWEIKPF